MRGGSTLHGGRLNSDGRERMGGGSAGRGARRGRVRRVYFGPAAQDAELVALGVGEDDPPLALGRTPVVVLTCSQREDPGDLLVTGRPVLGSQVQVQPVLHGL